MDELLEASLEIQNSPGLHQIFSTEGIPRIQRFLQNQSARAFIYLMK